MNSNYNEPGTGNIADSQHQHARQISRTRVVGQKERRVDARPLVTGAPVYAAEFEQPGMLHARILHSPHAHANIRHIDTSKALDLPGVYAVLTHHDLPRVAHTTAGQPYPELSPYDMYVLDSRVRYTGDWVAFVAAETIAIADAALKLIEVDYEMLPAVFDPLDATREGAPQLHEPDLTHPNAVDQSGSIYDAARNIVAHEVISNGDFDAALREADIIVEGEYRVPHIAHAMLEPHVCVAYLDGYERLIVVSSTQVPYHTRRKLAAVLQLPISRVRVVKPRVGGGFGGKQEMLLEPVAAALAIKTRRPVRIEYTRQEEFSAGRFRHPMIIHMRSGVKRDGTLLALSMHSLGNAGAYGTHSLAVTRATGHKSLCLYRAQAYQFEATSVYTNLPVSGAMRGYGAPQGFFALESHIDEIAQRLNMDPLAFRRKNHVQKGDWDAIEGEEIDGVWHSKRQFRSCGLPECLEKGAAAIGWNEPFERGDGSPIRRGRGLAIAMQGSGVAGYEIGGASIKLNEDGSFNVMTGATDIGQGSDTVLAQIAAEALGVGMEKIIMHSSDTDSSVFDYGAYASSTTYISGGGVKVAAERVRQQILDVAADLLDCAVEDMTIIDGVLYTPRGRSHLSIADIANETLYGRHRQQIMAKGDFWAQDSPAPFYAQFVEIEVDTETGQVRVTKAVNVLDLGRAINPTLATGQVEGAVTMALGYALSEEVKFDDQGRVRNAGFVDYKVMSTLDMPEMTTILVEDTEETGPYGAKSAGEVPINGMAPAIANAVYDALGVRIRNLPITPEKVLQALDVKKAQ
ncbi:MAG TPA: molybdopterin cofactor-binding domain-containing protein [Ktedonobacteraceae bacterium]|nr:molybdopterin cofactor-binding domain-containing protein [Ktedonobacteraceae bacterium]